MSNTILQMLDVEKGFKTPTGVLKVLKGVNLELKQGQSLSIRGESGAGKTTLLNVLTGLERLDSGDITWKGASTKKRSNGWLAKHRGELMGLIFQGYYLIPELNALENVPMASRVLGQRPKVEEAKKILEKVGLGERLNHLPTELSGGECQRVAVARALLNRPEIIIADEPTGNLDERTGEDVMEMLLALCSEMNCSLVLVTHNIDFAKRTERQLYLSGGILEII